MAISFIFFVNNRGNKLTERPLWRYNNMIYYVLGGTDYVDRG